MAKAKSKAVYSVVLREDIPPVELQFIQHLSDAIVFRKTGAKLRQFSCTKISTDDFHFLEMEVFKPGQSWLLPIRIPYSFVLLISGRDATKPSRSAGFVLASEDS
jgi:hypothetical protein